MLARAAAAGVEAVVAVGTGPGSNAAVLALARRYPGVGAGVGFHPERLDLTDADLDRVEAQAIEWRHEVVAIGEVGLPWYALAGTPDRGEASRRGARRLGRLLALAARLGLPVSLHAPHGVAAEALRLVERSGAGPVVFHWHKADPAVTDAIVAGGHFIGVTPEVLYRDRDQATVRAVPLGALLLESDGPWPYGGELGGRPGEPAMVGRVLAAVAQLRRLSVDELVAALDENAARCFGRRAWGAG